MAAGALHDGACARGKHSVTLIPPVCPPTPHPPSAPTSAGPRPSHLRPEVTFQRQRFPRCMMGECVEWAGVSAEEEVEAVAATAAAEEGGG